MHPNTQTVCLSNILNTIHNSLLEIMRLVALLLIVAAQCAVAFRGTSMRGHLPMTRLMRLNMVDKEAFQLVLIRHGESSWNKENRFTGWYDCPLSEKGHAEAAAAGALLQD